MSYYDPTDYTLEFYGRHLPHKEQDSVYQFVTFRLKDSLPKDVVSTLVKIKDKFELENPKPWSEGTQNKFNNLHLSKINKYLDEGYGECLLRKPEIRELFLMQLRKGFKKEYDVIAFVIMPTHIHLLYESLAGYKHYNIMSKLKGGSAYHINRHLSRSGALWQKESWDRMIRSPLHLLYTIDYIRKNPRKLPPSDYTLYINEDIYEELRSAVIEEKAWRGML